MRVARWCVVAVFILSTAHYAVPSTGEDAVAAEDTAQLRRPIAIVPHGDSGRFVVANQRSGSVSIVALDRAGVVNEAVIGERLSDLVALPAEGTFLATDETRHELVRLRIEDDRVRVMDRTPVAPYPVNVVVNDSGTVASVASLWSRQLTFLELTPGAPPRAAATIDLPFAPREQLFLPDGKGLIVADAFAGRLARVDVESGVIERVREFPGHNVRGLDLSTDNGMLLVVHQMLNDLAHSVRNDVHWGLLMSNDLRWLDLAVFESDSVEMYRGSLAHPLGEPGSATGDPSGLAIGPNGMVVVCLGGVNEIAFGRRSDFDFYRVPVGRRPTAAWVLEDETRALVANTFDDSLSLVDLEQSRVVETISLGGTPELSLADEGELLFFDASLSHDSWMSCHSCHTDGHTNGSRNDNFSDGSFGAPKRILSLLGRFSTAPFAWNGSVPDVETQVRNSIRHTMQSGSEPRDHQVEAIAAYLATLEAPPPVDRLRGREDAAAVARGQALFESLDCSRCHTPPFYTSPATYDVGLQDELKRRHFNPPSLIGLSQRGPYFHDNRAAELADVFIEFDHQLPRPIRDEELQDLLHFLRSL